MAAWLPSSWRCQVSPPSSLCRTTPLCPTAQPWVAEAKCTSVRATLTGTLLAWRQECPSSSDNITAPRSPTATSRSPARTTASCRPCCSRTLSRAGRSSKSGTVAPPAALEGPDKQAIEIRAAARAVRQRDKFSACMVLTRIRLPASTAPSCVALAVRARHGKGSGNLTAVRCRNCRRTAVLSARLRPRLRHP
ncbi:hypothetical protein D9M71_644770 [compost metagenome]